jgi:hypothetical protein
MINSNFKMFFIEGKLKLYKTNYVGVSAAKIVYYKLVFTIKKT